MSSLQLDDKDLLTWAELEASPELLQVVIRNSSKCFQKEVCISHGEDMQRPGYFVYHITRTVHECYSVPEIRTNDKRWTTCENLAQAVFTKRFPK